MPDQNAGHDARDRAQRQSDRIEARCHPEYDADADANNEPQAREALL